MCAAAAHAVALVRTCHADFDNLCVMWLVLFLAAVSTKMWRYTSNRYHQFIEDSANTMSGSSKCTDTVREALEE